MKRNFESKSIKNILGKLIDSSSNLNSGLNNIKVQKLWKEVMGSNVNSYTNEVILKNKTLYVNLNSSVLRQELSFGKQKIVDLLNKEIGKKIIQKIVLRYNLFFRKMKRTLNFCIFITIRSMNCIFTH